VDRDLERKMDVLDLLISTLREHEEKLDDLVTRLERLIDGLKEPGLFDHRYEPVDIGID